MSRRTGFLLLCAVAITLATAYTYRVWRQEKAAHPLPTAASEKPSTIVPEAAAKASAPAGGAAPAATSASPSAQPPRVLYRSTEVGGDYGRVALVRPGGTARFTDLHCERVHYSAGRGVCLTADRGVFTTYRAEIFDEQFHVLATVSLDGIPSRTKVSPDGKLAAITVFVSGHDYGEPQMSTHTRILSTTDGSPVINNLEDVVMTRAGGPFKQADFNFWGVTFAPDTKHYYATLRSGKVNYLIEGDIAAKTARVLREGVECPSLSPDGKLIAYKKREESGLRLGWRLYVLDLETLQERPLGETRSLDDQVEWLDAERVLYSLPNERPGVSDIWVISIANGSKPKIFMPNAYSPVVLR